MNNNMNFEYENEESINQNLKCSICAFPFIHPVETPCHHSFCSQCLNTWLNTSNSTCPTCRETITKQNIKQITVRSFLSLLDQLPVKCELCQESRIERGNFLDHITKKCPKVQVYCKAKDSDCKWTGLRDELLMHFETCPFQSEENEDLNEELMDVPEDHPSTGIFRRLENFDGTITMTIDQSTIIPSEDSLVRATIELITNNQCDTLEFYDHSIPPENLSIIAAALTSSRSVKNLNLTRCHINDHGIRLFANSLPAQTCLKSLNLYGNHITSDGMASIIGMLRTNRSLTKLVLTRNEIGNQGVQMLANLFYDQEIPLKELCIGSNYLITNECRPSIYTLIRWHRNLALLKLEDTKMFFYSLHLIDIFHKLNFRSDLRLVL